MSFSDPVPSKIESSSKFWITELNQSSVKSPYAIKFHLINKPENEKEITDWLLVSFGRSGYRYKVVEGLYYAEIFFKSESDATALILMWGDSFT